MAILNTRIKLRNDSISNWTGSTSLIYKGEVALGYDNSKYVIKIGTTDTGTTWDSLTENLSIPAANVVGIKDYKLVESPEGTFKLQYSTDGTTWTDVADSTFSLTFTGTYDKTTNPIALKDYVDAAVEGATTQYYEGVRAVTYNEDGSVASKETDEQVIARVVGDKTVKGGSTFVIKTLLDGVDKYEYIAFTYDTTTNPSVPTWKPMDGNYDWNTVYATENIMATKAVGTITIPTSGSTTFDIKGKSIKQIFEKLLAEEKCPTVTSPSASLTSKLAGQAFTADKSVEIGSTISLSYSTSLNAGSYTYGPETGVTAQSYNVVLKNGSTEVQTLTTSSGTFDSIVIGSGDSYTITSTITHNAGSTPLTNMGNDATQENGSGETVEAIAAGSESAGPSKTVKPYHMGRFYGTVTSKVSGSDLTSAQIRNLTKNNSSTTSGTFTFTVPEGAATIIIAAYGTKTLSKVVNTTVNADMTSSFAKTSGVTVAGADGDPESEHAGEYTVWTYSPASAYGSSANLSVTIA